MSSTSTTVPTAESVQAYLDAKATPDQVADARRLVELLSGITGAPPAMWGPSIVGFGEYRYVYASGRSGTASLAGFAIRGKELVLYLAPDWDGAEPLLARLGKHKAGKGCLYLKRLADVDEVVLVELVTASVAELRRRYPG